MLEFWLKCEKDKVDLLLPVTPGNYSITYGNSIETLELTNIGDINMIGNKRAINVKLSSFFSVTNHSYVNRKTYNVDNSFDYVKLVKKWINNKEIVRLIIANEEATRINREFIIEDITYSENGQTNKDINYTISLREYRKLSLNGNNSLGNTTNRTVKEVPNSNTYIVKTGDSLSKISRKMYGDGTKWRKIYSANKSIIGDNPNLIYPNQKLTIPGV